jgi:hypothetical protein
MAYRTDATYRPLYADAGSITYGAEWVKDEGDCASWVEIVDLDSAAGAESMVLVVERSIGCYSGSIAEQVQRLRTALESGIGVAEYRAIRDRATRRAVAWAEMARYGYGDTERETVLRLEKGGRNPDDWRADETVNGEPGLRRWLRQQYGLHFTRGGAPRA